MAKHVSDPHELRIIFLRHSTVLQLSTQGTFKCVRVELQGYQKNEEKLTSLERAIDVPYLTGLYGSHLSGI